MQRDDSLPVHPDWLTRFLAAKFHSGCDHQSRGAKHASIFCLHCATVTCNLDDDRAAHSHGTLLQVLRKYEHQTVSRDAIQPYYDVSLVANFHVKAKGIGPLEFVLLHPHLGAVLGNGKNSCSLCDRSMGKRYARGRLYCCIECQFEFLSTADLASLPGMPTEDEEAEEDRGGGGGDDAKMKRLVEEDTAADSPARKRLALDGSSSAGPRGEARGSSSSGPRLPRRRRSSSSARGRS